MTTLVIGAAVSGRAACRLLRSRGEKVLVYDADPDALAGIEADDAIGGAWDRRLLDGVELVVPSPGVPEHAAPLVDALGAGCTVWSEIELAYRHLPPVPLAAVTATNGKTTVTEIAAGMLQESGRRAAAVGNIGDPLSGAVDGAWDALVVETSSFQLRFVDSFRADAAVLLNVAPDHLDWHGTFEHYVAAKQRILERQTADDIVVFDADESGAVAAVAPATGRQVAVSGIRVPDRGWGVTGGVLVVGEASVPLDSMQRSDPVFVVDVAAAAVIAGHLGASADAIVRVAKAATGGRHRREVVGTWDGVTWVDDSKATNPHAAIASIRAFPSVVLIAGGRAKGLDITPLVAADNLRGVVAIGEAGVDLLAVRPGTPLAASMEEAVTMADGLARPGDTVLLAPGCASFDMFTSYRDRGDRFATVVRSRKEG